MTRAAARVLLGAGGLVGLGCLATGLVRTVQLERTPAAVAAERSGQLLVLVACLALLAVTALAARCGPHWAVVCVAAPAVVCGSLVVLAGGSLLPQLAALVALPVGLVGLVAVVVRG